MNYETIKRNYEKGLWTKAMVKNAVKRGIITPEQYEEIVGEAAPDLPQDLEQAKTRKINKLSKACKEAIEAGVTVNGKHYSMTTEDQLNLESLKTSIMGGATAVPYHADGESCAMYSADDFLAVYTACAAHKISQTTYFNQLRAYVQSLETVEEIEAVTYGQELTGEYLAAYTAIMGAVANA